MRVGCVVMAAGQGRRFGGNKLLAPLAGKPLLAHVLDALPRQSAARTAVVTTHDSVEEFCRARDVAVVRNVSGLLSESVRRGAQAMEGLDGCMFLMGDQPLCRAETLLGMLAAFDRHPDCVHRLHWEDTPSSPVIFPAALFPALTQLTGEQGGMAALRGRDVPLRLFSAAHESELWDVDTPEMLARAEEYLRSMT